jgi:hypothetical protein
MNGSSSVDELDNAKSELLCPKLNHRPFNDCIEMGQVIWVQGGLDVGAAPMTPA